MSDRSRDTSRALTEMRTVISRAKTALSTITHEMESQPGEWIFDVPSGGYRLDGSEILTGRWEPSGPAVFDPDWDAMITILDSFIRSADHWSRKGKS